MDDTVAVVRGLFILVVLFVAMLLLVSAALDRFLDNEDVDDFDDEEIKQ